ARAREGDLVRERLHGRQQPRLRRYRELHDQRRRLSDASAQGSAAAGYTLLQAGGAVVQANTSIRRNSMRINLSLATALALPALIISLQGAAAQTRTTLDIYVVDVEGGNATLFVPPSGEAVLIDSGNVGPAAARDA